MSIAEAVPPRRDPALEASAAPRSTARFALYAASLAVAISIWLLAIRAPLWLDETGSYWQINAGFGQIWPRQGICFPAYSYILWAWTRLLGTSEVALRTLSILAMLAAAYLLYLAARELFDLDAAIFAVVVFSVHPIVIFAAVDVRPYAFAILVTNAAILVLLRLRHNESNWLAALFGLLSAGTLYFHYLFAVILPALLLGFFVVKAAHRRAMWRQFGVAAAVFTLAFLPLIPGLRYLFHTSGTHVYEAPPKLSRLLWTIAPGWLPFLAVGAALVALLISALKTRQPVSPGRIEGWRLLVCASLALIPLLILFGVSVATPMHMFTDIHRTVAIPGIALCWAYLISRLRPRWIEMLVCFALSTLTATMYFRSPSSRELIYSWKDALQIAEKNASSDGAPVVVCSDFIESDYITMPLSAVGDNRFLAPLSYYHLSVPVVPLPRDFNGEATRVGSQFLREAAQKHERFLAMGDPPSYKTLDWLTQRASVDYEVRNLGIFDQTKVLEFDPRADQP